MRGGFSSPRDATLARGSTTRVHPSTSSTGEDDEDDIERREGASASLVSALEGVAEIEEKDRAAALEGAATAVLRLGGGKPAKKLKDAVQETEVAVERIERTSLFSSRRLGSAQWRNSTLRHSFLRVNM